MSIVNALTVNSNRKIKINFSDGNLSLLYTGKLVFCILIH